MKICSVDGCDRRVKAKGLCSMHYRRLLKTGTTCKSAPTVKVGCCVKGCDGKHFAKGYCTKHYTRVSRYGSPDVVLLEKSFSKTGICSVEGCDSPHKAKGYCQRHYLRAYRHGSVASTREFHGMSEHPLYHVWSSIKARCFNKNHHAYPHYGGRGITMHGPWAESFPSFLEGVGERPSDDLSIDRIDNDKGYEPGNVRWATRTIQAFNKRMNQPKGEDHYNARLTEGDVLRMRRRSSQGARLQELAEEYGVTKAAVSSIVNKKSWAHIA